MGLITVFPVLISEKTELISHSSIPKKDLFRRHFVLCETDGRVTERLMVGFLMDFVTLIPGF